MMPQVTAAPGPPTVSLVNSLSFICIPDSLMTQFAHRIFRINPVLLLSSASANGEIAHFREG